jgi:hypothetical protein
MKGLVRRNTQVKYESTYQSNIMTKVKVFQNKTKLQGQRSEDQGHGIKFLVKVLPEGIHM